MKHSAAIVLALVATAAPAVAPAQIPSLSERVAEKPDILGNPQCRFRAVPELLLTDNKPPVVKTASYLAIARQGGGKETRFSVGGQSGESVANWQGILAQPQLVLDHPAHRRAQVTRALVTIDGRPLEVPVAPNHEPDAYGSDPFVPWVTISPTTYNPGGLLTSIAGGATLEVRLYAGSRQLSQWTFDVGTLRHMPAALKGARWTCT